MAKIKGTNGSETLDGTNGKDKIFGKNGDDVLNGLDGNDYLNGGKGDDELNGGDGNDKLIGGKGDDELNGGDGNDKLIGGNGRDARYRYRASAMDSRDRWRQTSWQSQLKKSWLRSGLWFTADFQPGVVADGS